MSLIFPAKPNGNRVPRLPLTDRHRFGPGARRQGGTDIKPTPRTPALAQTRDREQGTATHPPSPAPYNLPGS